MVTFFLFKSNNKSFKMTYNHQMKLLNQIFKLKFIAINFIHLFIFDCNLFCLLVGKKIKKKVKIFYLESIGLILI